MINIWTMHCGASSLSIVPKGEAGSCLNNLLWITIWYEFIWFEIANQTHVAFILFIWLLMVPAVNTWQHVRTYTHVLWLLFSHCEFNRNSESRCVLHTKTTGLRCILFHLQNKTMTVHVAIMSCTSVSTVKCPSLHYNSIYHISI